MWADNAAVRATKRVQAFRETQPKDHRRQAAHVVVSPDDGDVKTKRQYWEGRSKAAEIAKEKGFRGFVVIPHPYRVTDEGKQQYEAEVPRGADGEPLYGVWVWLRNDVDDMLQYVYWSPHYHIIGLTSPDMEPAQDDDEWVYNWIRSFGRYDSIRDCDSHEEVYGAFRYLLSHTGFPAGSTKQIVTWYGDLANSVFVEDASEEWQHQKPSEGVLSALQREIEEAVEVVPEDDEEGAGGGDSDDHGDCPVEECGGTLIGVFDVRAYIRQSEPPPDVEDRMMTALRWRVGEEQPPPGLKHPTSEEQAREAFEALL
jgi:hypothetical protein